MSKISDFLPQSSSEKVLVQTRIHKDLHNLVKSQMHEDKKNGIKVDWTALFEAACKQYLSERKKKRASGT